VAHRLDEPFGTGGLRARGGVGREEVEPVEEVLDQGAQVLGVGRGDPFGGSGPGC
jgi:hypothetical protein